MTYPLPPGPGDQEQPPPDPLYQPPVEAYQPPPHQPPPHQPPPSQVPPAPAYPPYPGQPYQTPYQAPQPYQAPGQAYAAPAYQYGYPDPYGYSYQPPRPTDGLAVASLVVSCVAMPAICFYGVPGLIGIVGAILGHVARRRISRTGANGAGMALAGIIVGWIAAAIGAVATAAIIVLIINSDSF
jgi:hypothetical protein